MHIARPPLPRSQRAPGRHRPGPALAITLVWILGSACVSQATREVDARQYRLAGSGDHWDVSGEDRVFDDLKERYPSFFDVVLDPNRSDEPPTLRIRRDLEHVPVDRRNYDALNAIAIGYFELNYRGEASRGGGGLEFMSAGFRTAKLAAIPWRAYGEIQDPALRSAILDFFEDAGTGGKLGAETTAGRLSRIVSSLERKEDDPARKARIVDLVARIEAQQPTE